MAYSSTQFLQKSKEILKISIDEEIIREVNKANQFNLHSQVEAAVYQWAVANWSDVGNIHQQNEDNPADIVIEIDGILFAIEVKYYPIVRKQSLTNLIMGLHPKFEIKGFYDKYEGIEIIIVCETLDYAKELATQKYELSHSQLSVRFGYLNEAQEFVSL